MIEEGMEVGDKKKAMEAGKKAMSKGIDNETIKYITGLTIEKIEAIRNGID